MKQLIKYVPIPICGLVLAILTLGTILQQYNSNLKILCATVAILLLILILLKLFFYSHEIKNDLKNPILASVSGTFLMSLIVLSIYIAPFSKILGFYLWIFAILIFIILIIYFTWKFILDLKIETVFASYYIVYIGIAIASVTAPVHSQEFIGQIIFYFSSISFIFLLALTGYRYLKLKTPESAKPLICINAAPFSLLLVAYLKSFNQISIEFTTFMIIFAIIFYIFSLYKLIEYRKIPFYPSYSAYSFPFVVSALCIIESNKFLTSIGIKLSILEYIANIELIIAIILVIYVLIKYLVFLNKNRTNF